MGKNLIESVEPSSPSSSFWFLGWGTHHTSESKFPGSTEALGTVVLLHCALPPFNPLGWSSKKEGRDTPFHPPLHTGRSTLVPLSLRGRSPETCASVPAQDSLSPRRFRVGGHRIAQGKYYLPGRHAPLAAGGSRGEPERPKDHSGSVSKTGKRLRGERTRTESFGADRGNSPLPSVGFDPRRTPPPPPPPRAGEPRRLCASNKCAITMQLAVCSRR